MMARGNIPGLASRHASPGFTLLEVLVALTLLGLLAVLLTSGMSFGVRVWERSTRGDRASGDLLSTYRFFDDQLRAATEVVPPARQNRTDLSFIGSNSLLRFPTTGLSRVGLSGPVGLEVSLVGDRLVAHVIEPERLPAGSALSTATAPFTLLDGVKHFSLSYRGDDDKGAPKLWQADWPKSGKLPHLVRVDVARDQEPPFEWVFRLPDIDM